MTTTKAVSKGVKLPSSVQIGSQTYDIYERSVNADAALADSHAYTYNNGNFIVMNSDLHIQQKRRYLMHELLHAIIHVFGQNDKGSKDEKADTEENMDHFYIYLFQEPMVMLLRDNPSLVEFLTGE